MLYNCTDLYKSDIGYRLLFTFVQLELSIYSAKASMSRIYITLYTAIGSAPNMRNIGGA
jgi:hypothetical protein